MATKKKASRKAATRPTYDLHMVLTSWATMNAVLTKMTEPELRAAIQLERGRTPRRADVLKRLVARWQVVRDAQERVELLS